MGGGVLGLVIPELTCMRLCRGTRKWRLVAGAVLRLAGLVFMGR
jgi:hypothetical protein